MGLDEVAKAKMVIRKEVYMKTVDQTLFEMND